MRTIPLSVAAALVMWQVGIRAECITIGPAQPSKPAKPAKRTEPIRVSGAFCGRAFGRGFSAPISLKNSELDLIDERGVVVARAYPDSQANFKFSDLPPGKYRVTLPGFMSTAEIIEITSSNQDTCQR